MEFSGFDNEFRVRKANNEDIPVIEIYAELFNLDSEGLTPENIFVTEKNGLLTGFGRHKNYRNICEISTVGVLESYRNKGAGKILVKKLICSATSCEIWLTTVIPEYFEKFGFETCEDAPGELILKTEKLCKKFHKSPERNVFMKLIIR